MNPTDRYIPIEDFPKDSLPPVSQIVSRGNKVRVQDCLLEVASTNDAKGTVTFRLAGVFPAKVETVEGN
jgi:hypothetical protein